MLLELILSQISAWNRGDLNDFLSYYNDDIKVYSKPANEVVFNSKAALLPHIKPDFEVGKVEHVNVVDQVESSPYVLLLEEKQNEQGRRRAIVTYFVEGKKIKAMWIERVDLAVSKIPKSSVDAAAECKNLLLSR